ncbi:hypothetical protein OsJ_29302 [Oryza sativa Japonica Group]|uniref:Uncharacterized protein n=1 Tax=Oryza sativa subsp. japonica TaxID=39947 RepID=B9G3H7_ORYSJ|nr:hypothetical protein OsJ_29302 [Oryza sativa Japonica Group]
MAVLVSLMVIAASSPLVALLLRAAWVTLSCYWLTPMRIRRAMAAQGVRGPPPRPLVGNLREVSALVARATADDMPSLSHDIVGRLMPHYVLWSGTYGKLFVYLYGSEPRLCLTDTALIKEFLSSKVGRMVECTKQAIRELRDAAAGRRGEEVEIGAHMTRLTGDIISRTEFNTSYDTGKRIFLLLEHLQRLTSRSSRHLWIPGSQYFPSKYRREIRRLNGELEAVLMESIRRSREIADEGRAAVATYGRGLLAMLLSEMEEKEKNGGGGGGEFSYDAQLVIDECKTFFFAGHETSALLLTWAIMLLATNPAWQEKARTEVAAVCGDHPPSADHLSKLTVLQMIIQETLRLYPPATLLPRMAFEDIQLGGLRLPRGLSVWIPVLAIHHDESIWGPDAHEFRPERAYALVEAKVVLAMLLSAFRFAISDNYRHAPENVLTLRPKHGVPVHLRPLRP